MSRDWSKISPALWGSARFLGLETNEKLLLLYYMTNEHQSSAGAYRIPDGYALADLGWPANEYRAARAALEKAECIVFDSDTSELLVLRWFKHNPPTNQRHAKGTLKVVNRLKSDSLRELVLAEFAQTAWGADAMKPDASTAGGSNLLATNFMKGSR